MVRVLLLHAGRPERLRPAISGGDQARAARDPQGGRACASEPERAARRLVDGGFTARYDYALETLTGLSYTSWRDFDPEDTMRFYALRLHEVGMIKSTPQEIIANGTDWRFLNELKRELKT